MALTDTKKFKGKSVESEYRKFYESHSRKSYPDGEDALPKNCVHEISFGYMDQHGISFRADLRWYDHQESSLVTLESYSGWGMLGLEGGLLASLDGYLQAINRPHDYQDQRYETEIGFRPENAIAILERHGFKKLEHSS